jgi:succinylarginine dihydrolase
MSRIGHEVNFDGIVGLTHHFGGLSYGNIASMDNRKQPSKPKAAALQGLRKMKFLMDLGIKQAVLPPQERPHIPTLRLLGFTGSDQEIVDKAFKLAPEIFLASCSSSAMWTANAATISPSTDSNDGRLHITPANLSNKFHRSIEHPTTALVLKAVFKDSNHFAHHPILPPGDYFADEGAANHTRFSDDAASSGLQLFVYGRQAFGNVTAPGLYPARQTFEASEAVARRHQLHPEYVIFAQQNPHAINAGVFHNDVISVGHENLFLYHSAAFVDTERVIAEIRDKFTKRCAKKLFLLPVDEKRISIKDAVSSYLFNSQIVTLKDGTMTLIAPTECQEMLCVKDFLEEIVNDPANPIASVHYFNLKESMCNGGGPACLRLRVELTEQELVAANQGVFLNDKLYEALTAWVERYYRDRILPQDLADPYFITTGQQALDELSRLLKLGSIYSFQK